MRMNDRRVVLGAGGYVELDGKLYFAAINMAGFFQYNKSTGELACLPLKGSGLKEAQQIGYAGVCRFQDKIIFAPYHAHDILIYDVQNPKKSGKMDLDLLLPESGQLYREFIHAVAYSNLVYFFGWDHSEIICLNMDTETVCVVDTWKEAIAAHIGSHEFIGIHTSDLCILEGSVWAPLNESGCVLEFNLQTNEADVHRAYASNMRYATICFDGSDFWMSGNQKKIVRWKKGSAKTKTIEVFPKGFQKDSKGGEDYFYMSFYKAGFVYFFPWFANMALRVDVQSEEVEIFYQWDGLVMCDMVQEWEDDAFYLEWYDYLDLEEKRSTMVIDLDGKIREKNIFSMESSAVAWPEDDDGIYNEDAILTLENFLDKRVCCEESRSARPHETVGRKIYLEGKHWNR